MKEFIILQTVALLICSGIHGETTVPYETHSGDLVTQLLESQICDQMPHLPSCISLNYTLQNESDVNPKVGIFPESSFMTLVLDYIATTQRLNKELRERETQYIKEIARLELTKEHLENKVKSLEEDWLPTVDKHHSARHDRLEVSVSSGSESSGNEHVLPAEGPYQPTANMLRPVDCSDYLLVGAYVSGAYDIYPFRCRCSAPVKVWCDMETDGGGWTVILNRQKTNNPVNFTQPWTEYKKGFGNASNEYWIGNDILNIMTTTRAYGLRMDFEEKGGSLKWAEWPKFVVGDETNKYKLEVPDFNARSMTDNCLAEHRDKFFSTFDYDNDVSSRHCASEKKGGWWFSNCSQLDPTIPFNAEGHLNTECTYKVNRKNVLLQGPSLQLKVRPAICDQKVKAVHFNSHNCRGHNGY